ncbi:hypothetical protein CR513_30328, partial [Mucuna pruriens]
MNNEKLFAKILYFDGQHYDHWSELMENLLRAKGLWNFVKTGVEEPIIGTILTDAQLEQLEKFRTKDHKVKHYLFKAIDRSVFEQILDKSASKIAWDSLKRKFGGNDRVKKSMLNALRQEFEVLEMIDIETITEYFARVMAVANKIRSNGENMPNSKPDSPMWWFRLRSHKTQKQCPLMNFKALWWSMSKSSNQSAEMMSKYSRWRAVEAEEEDHIEVVDVEEEDNLSPKQLWSASSATI